ncbi:hypothetical protein [Streptomyces sp. NPDC019224]|uniref:hypothetical protein n=1 Tax=Streptomyces sp. NPDC019224 TaxID=3154484 RepID=UPI0033DD521B
MSTEAAVREDAVRSVIAALLGTELDPADDGRPLGERHERYDSLGVLDAVGEIEKAFGIAVDLVDDDLRTTFVSISSITGLIRRKKADQLLLGSGF